MVDYDSKVLQKFANQLYREANGVIAKYFSIGILMGVILGLAIAIFSGGKAPLEFMVVLLATIGALLGYVAGAGKAFHLRLQAQTLLCQVQIEENTRKQKDG